MADELHPSTPIHTLTWHDIAKGLITAMLGAVTTQVSQIVFEAIKTGNIQIFTVQNLQITGVVALGAFVGYIQKNFFTNSQDQFAKPEPPVVPPANQILNN